MKFIRSGIAFGRWDRGIRAVGAGLILGCAALAGAAEGIVRFAGSGPEESASASPAAESGPVSASSQGADPSGSGAATPSPPANPVWDLPNLDHPRVDYWVRRFTTDKREEFERFLARGGAYRPMISAKLAERGMPQDLFYLAMIESGFNPKAYSRAHASGLWQFIAATGRRYGLDINNAVDERNDPEKATDAALDYLTDLHDRFGSWYLAAAGYNTGEGRVGRIMRQVTGSERGRETDYYRIWSRLPRETRDYVPLMVAAARISKEPGKYEFDEVEIEAPLAYDVVEVGPSTPLRSVAEAAGTTVSELNRLNPHFKLSRTRNDMNSRVRVPAGGGIRFAAGWPAVKAASVANQETSEGSSATRDYRVRRGDNLTVIARRHGVTINEIRRANGIRGDRIRAGATLRIPD